MKRKNKKLLIQVGSILVPVFILMISAVTYAMYRSTVDGFLEAQDSHMTFLLEQAFENSIYEDVDEFAWFLDSWEKDPARIREPVSKHEENAAAAYDSDWEKEEDFLTIPWFERKPKAVRDYYIHQKYLSFINSLEFIGEENTYEGIFVIDLKEEYRGLVIAEYRRDGAAHRIGDRFDIDLSKHPAIWKMTDSGSDKTVFEIAIDFPQNGSCYIGYKPLVANGRVIAAIGIVYNWDDFRSAMLTTLKKTAAVSIGGILLAMVVIFILLYNKVVSPVRKIQKSVCEYISTKDSDTVISKMSGIRQRNELGLLSDNISELAKEIDQFTEENIKLAGERERVAAELDMAKSIQTGQLPSEFPAFPDRPEFDIYASMTPAKEVGGDFYDFFLIDSDHLAMVMADVSGKGVPAALFMMMSKILINNYAMMGLSPHEVLERTNETICKNNKQKMFVTVWFGILEISTGKITAANAGHEYPIIRQPDGDFELFKDKHGFVIGGIPGKKYKEYGFTLQKGGTLFVYTDGIPEATNSAEEMFGVDRLIETMNRHKEEMPGRLLAEVHGEVNAFVGDAPQFDDLTMLGITLL